MMVYMYPTQTIQEYTIYTCLCNCELYIISLDQVLLPSCHHRSMLLVVTRKCISKNELVEKCLHVKITGRASQL